MREIDGHTKLLGLMGYPVEHTYSPQMHNYISQVYGRNYAYTALPSCPGSTGRCCRDSSATRCAA